MATDQNLHRLQREFLDAETQEERKNIIQEINEYMGIASRYEKRLTEAEQDITGQEQDVFYENY